MNSPTKALYAAGILLLLILVHILHYYPQLPDRVADHFDIAGNPNGFSDKVDFVFLYVAIVLLVAVIFIGIAFLMPKFPPKTMNLPNKEYWLSGKRRGRTYGFLANQLIWMGNLTMVFIAVLMHLTMIVNASGTQRMGSGFWWILGVYLLLITVLCIHLILRFIRVPERGESYERRRSP